MKYLLLATLTGLLSYGQNLTFNLDQISAKASEKVELDLDEGMIKAALPLAQVPKKLSEAASKIDGLKKVILRHYEFATANAYSENDLSSLRQQVSADKTWGRLLTVKDKSQSIDVSVTMTLREN